MKYINICLILLLCFGCRRVNTHSHGPGAAEHSHTDDRGNEEAGHSHEEGALSFTRWTKELELFVEFPSLIVGNTSPFAAHYTRLEGYDPVREGRLTVSLIQGRRGIRHTVEAPASPGIFTPALQPKTAGTGRLVFDLELDGRTHRIELDSVEVYPDAAAAQVAMAVEEPGVSEISFLKEQAWRIDFTVALARQDYIRRPVRTAGELLSAAGGEEQIVAPSSGIVSFRRRDLAPGQYVRPGEWLFTLNFTGDPEENLNARMEKARLTLERAQREFERQKVLAEGKASSQKDLEEAQLNLDLARAEYDNLMQYQKEGGRKIAAPSGGYVKAIHLQPGGFVTTGQSLVTLTQQRRLRLRADLPQNEIATLAGIQTASFRLPGEDRFQSISTLNGRRLPSGLAVDAAEPFVPVYFEIDNLGHLLPGAFVEVLLFAGSPEKKLIVPRSALLEEYGNYSVIVQRGGETFEKRPVNIGIDDGQQVEIRSGLRAGEMVVTQGAYQVKMASMTTAIPAHGHSH